MENPFDSPHKQSSLLAIPYRLALCGMGESNSQPQFGKLTLYHLTNPALPVRSFNKEGPTLRFNIKLFILKKQSA